MSARKDKRRRGSSVETANFGNNVNSTAVFSAASPGKKGIHHSAGATESPENPAAKKARRNTTPLGVDENAPVRRTSLLQTAGGKGVTISEEARRKSMSVLEPGHTGTSSSGSGSDSGSNAPVRRTSLLQTAGGKGVTISEEARRKSMSVLEPGHTGTSSSGSGSGSDSGSNAPVRRTSLLQTAGGKGVTISEEARRKSMSVLEPGHTGTSSSGSGSGSDSGSNAPVRRTSLLQTAGGKGVTISEEARRKSMSVLEPGHTGTSSSGSGSGSDSGSNAPVRRTSLLQTAGGKGVTISEEARRKSMSVLEPGHTGTSSSGSGSDSDSNAPVRRTSLLQTAGGKGVTISEEARRKSMSVLEPGHTGTSSSGSGSDSGSNAPVRRTSLLQTAGGKGVTISEEARRKSMSVLEPGHTGTSSSGSGSGSDSGSNAPVRRTSLLQTAGGKGVTISEEARRKSMSVLEPGHTGTSSSGSGSGSDSGSNAPVRRTSLLQTAGGKGVTISEEARRKSMSVLEPGHTGTSSSGSGSDSGSNAPVRRTSLLQTAGGKGVTISEEARRKSMSVLEGGSISAHTPTTTTTAFCGAQQATDALKSGGGIESADRRQSIGYHVSASQGQLEIGEIEMLDASLIFTQSQGHNASQEDNTTATITSTANNSGETPCYPGASLLSFCVADVPSASQQAEMTTLLPRYNAYDVVAACTSRVSRYQQRLHLVNRIRSTNAVDLLYRDLVPSAEAMGAGTGLLLLDSVRDHLKHTVAVFTASSSFSNSRERENWLRMQVRWVVWTLAAQERRQPQSLLFALLSPQSVAQVVHYRLRLYTRTVRDAKSPFKALSVLSRSGALRHFSRSGGNLMSPLQRCTDIRALVWPLVLCFCVGTSSATDGGKPCYSVCDSWWFTPVELDADLLALVQSGKLRDGCKVAVFTGAFAAAPMPTSEGGGEGTVLSLHANGLRQAHKDAPWGYINPRYLSRGLALNSLAPAGAGGGVYAIRVRVVRTCAPMTRIRAPFFATLDAAEHKAFQTELRHLQGNAEAGLEGHEQLSVKVALDNLCLDDARWALDVLAEIDGGGHVPNLSAAQEASLPGILQRVMAERMRLKEGLLRELMEHLEVAQASYRDVLVRCEVSGALAWVRVAEAGGDGGGGDSSTRDSWATGQAILVTNLKPLRTRGPLPLLQLGVQSTVQPIPQSQSQKDGSPSSSSVRGATLSQCDPTHCRSSLRASLDNLRASDGAGPPPGSEISFEGLVLEWTQRDITSGVKSAVNDLCEIEIVLTDPSRVLVALKYIVPRLCVRVLQRWLTAGAKVRVFCAAIEHVDCEKEVLSVARGDRTTISLVSAAGTGAATAVSFSSSSSRSGTAHAVGVTRENRRLSTGSLGGRRRTSIGRTAAGGGATRILSLAPAPTVSLLKRNQTTVDRRKTLGSGPCGSSSGDGSEFAMYPTVSADAKSTAGDLALLAMSLRAEEEERRRWHALQHGKTHFNCALPYSRVEACARSVERAVTLSLPSAADLAGLRAVPDGLFLVQVSTTQASAVAAAPRIMTIATPLLEQSKGPSSTTTSTTATATEPLLARLRAHEGVVVNIVCSAFCDRPVLVVTDPTDGSERAEEGPQEIGHTIVFLEEVQVSQAAAQALGKILKAKQS